MNPTHIHLVITHLPIFGTMLGALVLSYALWIRSDKTKGAAYLLFVVSSIGAGIAYLTGESAEETVENIQGISEVAVEQHEDFALFALISIIVLGLISLVSIYLSWKKSPQGSLLAKIVLVLSLISFIIFARTGYFGGQIRHTEISSNPQTSSNNGVEDDDH